MNAAGERDLRGWSAPCILALSVALAQPALAQTPADFYRGKSLELYIGSSVGGGYDAYARMLARHMGRFIPGNPTVIVQNVPGARGMTTLAMRSSRATMAACSGPAPP